MKIDHTNLRKTLQSLDKTRVLELCCNRNVNSVCSLLVFTQILKADLFKYQIEFKDMDKNINFLFKVDSEEFVLSNDKEGCSCGRSEIVGVAILYKVIKSIDFLKVETMWPIAVCFSHYKIFLNEKRYVSNTNDSIENLENKENKSNSNDIKKTNNGISVQNESLNTACKMDVKYLCNTCNTLQEEIFYSIRMLNSKFEGLFIQKKLRIDFISGSTLFQSLKSDIKFVHDKKLFYSKNGSAEKRIGEFLARWGISISNANDPYLSLDSATKKQCCTTFGEEDKLIYKNGHDIEVSAVEHSFLILFYLYKEKDMYSYMCLEKRKLIDTEKISKFYEKIVAAYKDSVVGATRAGDLAIFKIKSDTFSIAQIASIFYVLHCFFRIYLRYREESHFRICIVYGVDEEHQLLYSEDVSFGSLRDLKTTLGENLVKIQKKSFIAIIKELIAQNR